MFKLMTAGALFATAGSWLGLLLAGFLIFKIIQYFVLIFRNAVRRAQERELLLKKWGVLVLIYTGVVVVLTGCYFIKFIPLDEFLELTIGCLTVILFIAVNALVTHKKVQITFDPNMSEEEKAWALDYYRRQGIKLKFPKDKGNKK